mmetsp:Transcript_18965/g.41524  ORF Transcript_18965/g.41524 Transcript_18965/m.41524 type:complete len:208 (+) Transcript_18965:213-836(+)
MRCPLGHKNDEDNEENHEHKENLQDEPPVGGDAIQVLEQVGLRHLHVGQRLVDVLVDAHCQLALLRHHGRQLLEDPSQLCDGRLDILQRLGAAGMHVGLGHGGHHLLPAPPERRGGPGCGAPLEGALLLAEQRLARPQPLARLAREQPAPVVVNLEILGPNCQHLLELLGGVHQTRLQVVHNRGRVLLIVFVGIVAAITPISELLKV